MANTKRVKVCGYRSNVNPTQTWWVDTGIFVTSGNLLTINATNPEGSIAPYPGSPGWSPQGNLNETNWIEALAYVTSELQLPSFSLIGKIGRSGGTFAVGQSRTFTPTTTGTLFLSCNDGVNFEDNTGYWMVTVNFTELVQLDPSNYGGKKIYADHVDTSLVDTWGVILTVEEDLGTIVPNLGWNATAIANVTAAFSAVDARLQAQANRTFKQVFAGLEMRLSPDLSVPGYVAFGFNNLIRFGIPTLGNPGPRPDDRTYGRINPGADYPYLDYYPSPTSYGFFNANDKGIQNTIIHELGHTLFNRSYTQNPNHSMYTVASSGTFRLQPMRGSTSQTQDSTADVGIFWENPANDVGEFVPDNFLSWVRNSYVGVVNGIDSYSPNLPQPQMTASAYWTGVQITTSGGVMESSPGIGGFTNDAQNYANSSGRTSSLFRYGPGETTCV